MSPFATFETDMIRHRKFQELPDRTRPLAVAIHVAFILYSAEMLTDGEVRRGIAMEICRDLGMSRPRKTLFSMCEVGLLTADNKAFYVHDYADFQPTRAEIEERRKRDAQRKRDKRLGRDVPADVPTESTAESASVHAHAPAPSSSSPSSSSSTSSLGPAAAMNELRPELEALGWRDWQISRALQEVDRARSWLTKALEQAHTNRGGYAWTGFVSGEWAEPPNGAATPEQAKMAIAEACSRWLDGHGWDESFTWSDMLEEFERKERRPTTSGTLTDQERGRLKERWLELRGERFAERGEQG